MLDASTASGVKWGETGKIPLTTHLVKSIFQSEQLQALQSCDVDGRKRTEIRVLFAMF